MDFTWVAKDYSQNSQFQYKHAKKALSNYTFCGDEIVLDVGCGDGKITAEIAKMVPQGKVIGIDSSPQMIEFSKENFCREYKNLTFSICQAEKILFKNKFDLIVSFACLHWVKEQLKFLQGARDALKERGKIILNLYPKHPYIWDAIEETANSEKWKKYFINYRNPHISYEKETYQKLCEKAGLKIKYLKESVPVAYFSTRKEMEDFLRSWLPHTDKVTLSLQNKFISAIVEKFLQKDVLSKSKKIGMPFRRLDAILIKI